MLSFIEKTEYFKISFSIYSQPFTSYLQFMVCKIFFMVTMFCSKTLHFYVSLFNLFISRSLCLKLKDWNQARDNNANVLFHSAQSVQRDYASHRFATVGFTFTKLRKKGSQVHLFFFAVLICNTDLNELNEGNPALFCFCFSLSVYPVKLLIYDNLSLWDVATVNLLVK